MFNLNNYLYRNCIRSWKVQLRYKVVDVDSAFRVKLEEDEAYKPVRAALAECKKLIDEAMETAGPHKVHAPEMMLRLKEIMRACGQDCDNVLATVGDGTIPTEARH